MFSRFPGCENCVFADLLSDLSRIPSFRSACLDGDFIVAVGLSWYGTLGAFGGWLPPLGPLVLGLLKCLHTRTAILV